MIESKRADKKKNLDKTTASLVKNPLQSEREIAKDIGVSRSTAHIMKKEIEQSQAKDDRIVNLTDKDFELMQKIQARKFVRMDDLETPVDDTNLNNWDREAKARYSLFRGDITGKDGGMKNTMAQYTDEELLNITNGN